MEFRECEMEEFEDALRDGTSNFAIILAPNFEARSVTSCEDIVEQIRRSGIDRQRIHWIVLTLQGQNSKEILDALKSVNTRKVLTLLEKAGYDGQVQHQVIDYPIGHDKFAGEIWRLFRELRADKHLVIDFSALPRNLLSNLLKQVSQAGKQGAAFSSAVSHVWLFYTWAAAYPEAPGPEFLGEVVGHFTSTPLRKLLDGKTHVEMIVFTGGSTYDAYNAVELARERGLGNQSRIHLVNFIHNNNLHESIANLRNHYGMISDAKDYGANVQYVFTVRHALALMREVAAGCAKLRDRSGVTPLFAIGPFGPKPLAVAAHFVRQEYLAHVRATSVAGVSAEFDEADVLNSSGSQYLSPYSLGAAGRTIFRYEPTPGEFL